MLNDMRNIPESCVPIIFMTNLKCGDIHFDLSGTFYTTFYSKQKTLSYISCVCRGMSTTELYLLLGSLALWAKSLLALRSVHLIISFDTPF